MVLHVASLQRILSDYVQLTSGGISSSQQLAQQLRPAIVSLLNAVDQHALRDSSRGYGVRTLAPSQCEPGAAEKAGIAASRHGQDSSSVPWQQIFAVRPPLHNSVSLAGCLPVLQPHSLLPAAQPRAAVQAAQHAAVGLPTHYCASPPQVRRLLTPLDVVADSCLFGARSTCPSETSFDDGQATSHRSKRAPKKRRLQAAEHQNFGDLAGCALAADGVLGRALNPQSMLSLLEAGDLQVRSAPVLCTFFRARPSS